MDERDQPRKVRHRLAVLRHAEGDEGDASLQGATSRRHNRGTVGVTAVGMLGAGRGFAIAQPTLMSLRVVV